MCARLSGGLKVPKRASCHVIVLHTVTTVAEMSAAQQSGRTVSTQTYLIMLFWYATSLSVGENKFGPNRPVVDMRELKFFIFLVIN